MATDGTLTIPTTPRPAPTDEPTALLEQALFEAKRVLVGQDLMIERLFICWLARHCLLEGAPGLAKRPVPVTRLRARTGHRARDRRGQRDGCRGPSPEAS